MKLGKKDQTKEGFQMSNRSLIYILIVSALLFSGCLISGKVVDENGVGVAGVTVTLSGGEFRAAITDSEGKYQFGDIFDEETWVAAGNYTVTPSGSGYTPASTNVTITTETLESKVVPWPVFNVDFIIQTSVYLQANEGTGSLDFLSQVEKEIIIEINKARLNPVQYAEKLEARLPYYNGTLYSPPGAIPIQTFEGAAACQEAINVLKNLSPVQKLKVSKGISQAASDHVDDQSVTGALGHDGADGSDPFERMNRYGTWGIIAGENISYGASAAEDIVIGLIIDDNVPSRGHRDNIFRAEFGVIGLANGSHAIFGSMSVHDFAGSYTEANPDPG